MSEALDHEVRQLLEHHPVLERARLGLVRVHDGDLARARLVADEPPLQARGKARPAHAAQARRLEDLGHVAARGLHVGEESLQHAVVVVGRA